MSERMKGRLDRVRQLVNAQALDDGLWFVAQTAPEAYLQQELRRLHAAIEESPAYNGAEDFQKGVTIEVERRAGATREEIEGSVMRFLESKTWDGSKATGAVLVHRLRRILGESK